jgi:hypothetical protein
MTNGIPMTIASGEFKFNIERSDSVTEHTLDVLDTKLLCEELEQQHALQKSGDGRLVATTDFLRDLASKLPIENCSSSIAYQVWVMASNKIAELKKNMS